MRSTGKFSKHPTSRGGYAYTLTRVRVKKSRLIPREEYARLLKMGLSELAKYLGESTYREEINELGASMEGAPLLEYALSKNLETTFTHLLSLAMEGSRGELALYLRKWDVWSIKAVLRGKYSHAPEGEIISSIVAAGELDRAFFEKVAREAEDLADAVERFRGARYYPLMKANIHTLTELEDALDLAYYQDLLQIPDRQVQAFVREQVSLMNALNTHRAEKAGVSLKMIPGGRGTAPALEGVEQEFRTTIQRQIVGSGIRMLHRFSFSAAPIIGFCVAKENEVRNLRILVRGKHAGLPEELIEQQLVVV